MRSGRTPALLLIDTDLWGKFHEHQNEMILTKSGRCLFPCLRFKAVNLNPDALYTIRLDFERLDSRRLRFCDGNWTVVSSSKRQEDDSGVYPPRESYTHPGLYQTGEFWMQGSISFANVKLSNAILEADTNHLNWGSNSNDVRESNHLFHMVSFAKYRPRVYLIERARQSHAITFSGEHTFDRTTFVAVTHYQNHRVNDLKKAYNPHAKGFRDTIGTLSPPSSRKRRHPCPRSSGSPGEYQKKRYRSRSVSTECETDISEDDVPDSELLESSGERLSMDKYLPGYVKPRGEKSAMVTLSLRKNMTPRTWGLCAAKESPLDMPNAPCWKAVETNKAELANTQKSRVLGTLNYHQAVSSERFSTPTSLEREERSCWLGNPLVPATEFNHLQEILAGVDPILNIPLGQASTFIDTAPASLFYIPNPSSSSLSLQASLDPDHLSLSAVNQIDNKSVSLADPESSVAQGVTTFNKGAPFPGPQPTAESSPPLDIGNIGQLSTYTDPRILRATILESKTFMSASSVISLSPFSVYRTQAQTLRENLCLKAFIRERYGQEAEADANAVVAMDYHK
ncbi:T-box transcription factor tbx21 [Modicella reniformis]|uniref:T-box transcription factor tbx21 n=1 Tax=Modicella reniformis TaxID=1440133 RepID=A0A9P6SVC8_9FUNG|nr:T-box transcription factor tbx21 [Modicella reniformis]